MDLPENSPFKCSPVSPARDPLLSLTAACCPRFIAFDHHLFHATVHNIPRGYMCVCRTCVLSKVPIRVHFINPQVNDRNSLASIISLMILNKVNTNIYMAFAQEEYQAWECEAICSCSFWHKKRKVQATRKKAIGVGGWCGGVLLLVYVSKTQS